MRPPGAHPRFDRLCDRCGACAPACPAGIVLCSPEEGPHIDFTLGSCTFCGECASACPTGALVAEEQSNWPWRAAIAPSCLSRQGVSCRACEDACEPRAIRFRLLTAGRAEPEIDTGLCNGCGECAYTCPAGSVVFERLAPRAQEPLRPEGMTA